MVPGTAAALTSPSGIPCCMYQAMALGSRGASPCPSSSFTVFWSALYTRIGTSPPTQNAPTYVTDSASSVAAPASAAFPPCSRILMPAAVAAGLPETTTPWLPVATLGPRGLAGVFVTCGRIKGATKTTATDDIEMILRIRGNRSFRGHHCPACHQTLSTLFRRCLRRRHQTGELEARALAAFNRLALPRVVSTR